MVYPNPNAVSTRLIIAIRSSIVIIRIALLCPYISVLRTDFYVIGGSQSLRGGLTAYRYGIALQNYNISTAASQLNSKINPKIHEKNLPISADID